jgi:hypothetical protein
MEKLESLSIVRRVQNGPPSQYLYFHVQKKFLPQAALEKISHMDLFQGIAGAQALPGVSKELLVSLAILSNPGQPGG